MARAHLAGVRAFAIFSLNAATISWLCWLPLVAADRHLLPVPEGAAPLLLILGSFGPLLAALGIVARDGGMAGVAAFSGRRFAGGSASAGTWRLPSFPPLSGLPCCGSTS